MVITSTIGNRVAVMSGTWVQIPPTPPEYKPLKLLRNAVFSRVLFIFETLLNIPKETQKNKHYCVKIMSKLIEKLRLYSADDSCY